MTADMRAALTEALETVPYLGPLDRSRVLERGFPTIEGNTHE